MRDHQDFLGGVARARQPALQPQCGRRNAEVAGLVRQRPLLRHARRDAASSAACSPPTTIARRRHGRPGRRPQLRLLAARIRRRSDVARQADRISMAIRSRSSASRRRISSACSRPHLRCRRAARHRADHSRRRELARSAQQLVAEDFRAARAGTDDRTGRGAPRGLPAALREATMPQDWRPQDQKTTSREPLKLAPGDTGISALRARYSQPLTSCSASSRWCCSIACAQHGQPAARAVGGAAAELAVRLSLGASRWLVARQLLVESLMLSMHRRRRRPADRALGQPRARRADVDAHGDRRARPGDGLARARRSRRGRRADRPAVRRRAGAPRDRPDAGGCPARSLARRRVGRRTLQPRARRSSRCRSRSRSCWCSAPSLFVRTLVDLTSQNMGFESVRVLIAQRRSAAHRAAPTRSGRRCSSALRDAVARGAGRRGRRGVGCHAGEQQRLEQSDQRARLRRARARRGALLQWRHARLSSRRWARRCSPAATSRVRSLGRAERRPRQRGVREEVLQAARIRSARRFTIGTGPRPNRPRWKSSAWSPTPSTAACASRRRRPCMPPGRRTETASSVGARQHPRERLGRSRIARRRSQAIAGVHKDIVVDFKAFEEDLRATVIQERLVAIAVGLLRRARAAARRARPLRRDVVHRRAAPQRDRHPHGARRRAGQGDAPRARTSRSSRSSAWPSARALVSAPAASSTRCSSTSPRAT